jgi:hypothetical protein
MRTVSELAGLVSGSVSSDIVPGRDNVDAKAAQRHEQEQLEQRIEEETGKVKKRKCNPIEYLLLFGRVPKLDQIQVLKSENLTKDDAVKFIEAGCTRKHLADMYGMSVGKLYSLLTEWGLHTPKRKAVDKPVDIPVDTVEPEPVLKPVPELVPEPVPGEMADALESNITWLVPVESLPKITISGRNEISLNRAAVITAPDKYQQGCKARIGVDTTQNTLIIQPVAETEEGYTFRQRGWLLKVSSKWVKEGLIKAGMDIPAAFEVSWNNDLQAWVGRLIREEEVV